MRISDWSSDVCSSDLALDVAREPLPVLALVREEAGLVRAGRVGAEADAVLADDRRRRVAGARAVPRLDVERFLLLRSEARPVGNECVRTCRCRGSPDH